MARWFFSSVVIFNEVSIEKKDLRDQIVTAIEECEWHEEFKDARVRQWLLMGLDSLKKRWQA